MFFALEDDGSLTVLETIADVRLTYEGIDVEAGAFSFYDSAGRRLRPRFTKPNRRWKLFGLIRLVDSGAYELVAADALPGDDLLAHLNQATGLRSNARFQTLEAVRQHLVSLRPNGPAS